VDGRNTSGGILAVGNTLTSNASISAGGISVRVSIGVSVLLVADVVDRVADVESETRRLDVAMTPEKESTKNWFGKDIENTVEDGLGIRGDDVATLAQTPGDWVQEPKTDGPDTADSVGLVDISSKVAGVGAAFEDNGPGDKEEGNTSESEVAPFVGALDECTNETGHNHDLVNQDGVADCWIWETAGQEEIQEQQRSGDKPVDVADIEDLAHVTRDLRIAAKELNMDSGPAKIGSHAEVSNSSNHGDGGSDVVEDASVAGLCER